MMDRLRSKIIISLLIIQQMSAQVFKTLLLDRIKSLTGFKGHYSALAIDKRSTITNYCYNTGNEAIASKETIGTINALCS